MNIEQLEWMIWTLEEGLANIILLKQTEPDSNLSLSLGVDDMGFVCDLRSKIDEAKVEYEFRTNIPYELSDFVMQMGSLATRRKEII